MNALGIYIFAGGFSVGMRAAGFDVLGHLEDGPFGADTVRQNMPDIDVHANPETWPFDAYRGRGVEVVFCNPPCAPWSGAGIRPKRMIDHDFKDNYRHDPRVSCVYNAFDAIRYLRPAIWAWESVQGAFHRGREMCDELAEEAVELGYSVSYVLLNGVHVGLPQQRRRFFFVAHRVKIDWEYPRLEADQQVSVMQAWRAAGLLKRRAHVAFRHMENDKDREMMEGCPQGQALRLHWEAKMRATVGPEETWPRNKLGAVIGRPAFTYRRLRPNVPCKTMMGGTHLVHPTEDRWLSVKESQVLCGYPADYEFSPPTPEACYPEVAQAVLPTVGEWLGHNLRRAVERGRRQRGRRFVVDLEKDHTEEIIL